MMCSTSTILIVLITISISTNGYETTFKYETKKHLQCSGEYFSKGEWFSKLKNATKACDENKDCFGLYDVSCHGSGFYLCINKKRWSKLRSYEKRSNTSCIHFKPQKLGIGTIEDVSSDESDHITSATANGSGRSMKQGISIEAALILFGFSFLSIAGIVGVSVTAACLYKRRTRKFAGCDRRGENIRDKNDSYGYDLPDISLKISKYSLDECYQMMTPTLNSYKREQVIQNPYYGIVENSTTN